MWLAWKKIFQVEGTARAKGLGWQYAWCIDWWPMSLKVSEGGKE